MKICKKVCDVYIKNRFDGELHWIGTIRYANYDELNQELSNVKKMYQDGTEFITKERI